MVSPIKSLEISPLTAEILSQNYIKKADFENLKVIGCDFSTKWSQYSTIFALVRFSGGTKFVLCAESL